MSRSLPATSCTGGVRRRSRYLALTFFTCTRYFIQLNYFKHHIFMRSGKNVQRATRATGNISSDSVVPDRQEDIGSSTQPTTSTAQPSTSNVEPRPEAAIVELEQTPRSSPIPQSTVYQNVLVEEYRKGKMSKPTVYSKIRAKLASSLEEDTDRIDAAFGSFIATVESHDSETAMAARRGARGGVRHRAQSPFSNVSEPSSDEEPVAKKSKVDESAFAWTGPESQTNTKLSDNSVRTLKLLGVYTVDPKTTLRSLTNSPSCPEFPDSEWKNVIGGKAVSLDAVLSGQLSTTNDELKIENFGDLELSFGAVEPTKIVKNGGEWSIAWNRTVRATVFAFPHRLRELTGYGEYIISMFAVTHPNFTSRIISFDKAVRKRVGSVRNIKLSDYHKFADLKIAHVDSVGVSACAEGSTRGDQTRKPKRGKGWKRSEPCNKWNDGTCGHKEEDCRRDHVCNRCKKRGHKGKDCRKPST